MLCDNSQIKKEVKKFRSFLKPAQSLNSIQIYTNAIAYLFKDLQRKAKGLFSPHD